MPQHNKLHSKPFFAKAAIEHFVTVAEGRKMPVPLAIEDAISEVKALAAKGRHEVRLKFVLDPAGSIPTAHWKTWFVTRLLGHLGFDATELEVKHAVKSAQEKVAKKLNSNRQKPRLILIVDAPPN